jgi:hypothetical protein
MSMLVPIAFRETARIADHKPAYLARLSGLEVVLGRMDLHASSTETGLRIATYVVALVAAALIAVSSPVAIRHPVLETVCTGWAAGP